MTVNLSISKPLFKSLTSRLPHGKPLLTPKGRTVHSFPLCLSYQYANVSQNPSYTSETLFTVWFPDRL